jgi:hypothetical protein
MNTWKHTTKGVLAGKLPSTQTGKLHPTLTKKERAGIEAVWTPEQRNRGFHLFCRSLEKAVVEEKVKTKQRILQQEALDRGEEAVKEEVFSLKHQIKSEMWNELSKEERERWREEGKKADDQPEVWMDQ